MARAKHCKCVTIKGAGPLRHAKRTRRKLCWGVKKGHAGIVSNKACH